MIKTYKIINYTLGLLIITLLFVIFFVGLFNETAEESFNYEDDFSNDGSISNMESSKYIDHSDRSGTLKLNPAKYLEVNYPNRKDFPYVRDEVLDDGYLNDLKGVERIEINPWQKYVDFSDDFNYEEEFRPYFEAEAYDSDDKIIEKDYKYEFVSTNPEVAVIYDDGTIYPLSPGFTRVKATLGSGSDRLESNTAVLYVDQNGMEGFTSNGLDFSFINEQVLSKGDLINIDKSKSITRAIVSVDYVQTDYGMIELYLSNDNGKSWQPAVEGPILMSDSSEAKRSFVFPKDNNKLRWLAKLSLDNKRLDENLLKKQQESFWERLLSIKNTVIPLAFAEDNTLWQKLNFETDPEKILLYKAKDGETLGSAQIIKILAKDSAGNVVNNQVSLEAESSKEKVKVYENFPLDDAGVSYILVGANTDIGIDILTLISGDNSKDIEIEIPDNIGDEADYDSEYYFTDIDQKMLGVWGKMILEGQQDTLYLMQIPFESGTSDQIWAGGVEMGETGKEYETKQGQLKVTKFDEDANVIYPLPDDLIDQKMEKLEFNAKSPGNVKLKYEDSMAGVSVVPQTGPVVEGIKIDIKVK